MKVAVVVPTCRGFEIPTQSIPIQWIIVHDRKKWPVINPLGGHIDIIAPNPHIFGEGSDSIRSSGFLRAHYEGADFILTTDDDCFLPYTWAEEHVEGLEDRHSAWTTTYDGLRVRGLPYQAESRPVAITHGLWDGVPDLDHKQQDQWRTPFMRVPGNGDWQPIAPPFPMCGMNLGFAREVTLCMYFPPQGPAYPFDRFADIWAGLIAQRVLSLHDYSFNNGGAILYHKRASDIEANRRKETPGMEEHETFWRWVWAFNDPSRQVFGTYLRLADHIGHYTSPQGNTSYFRELAHRMHEWERLLHAGG